MAENTASMPRLLRLPTVMELTGLSRSAIYLFESRGQFPSRVRLTPTSSAWKANDVADWINSRPVATRENSPQPRRSAA